MKLSNNGVKIFTIGGMVLMGTIATAPVMGACVTGILAKVVWVTIAGSSVAVLVSKE